MKCEGNGMRVLWKGFDRGTNDIEDRERSGKTGG